MLTTRLLRLAIPKAESSKQAQQRVASMARCISSVKGKERETCPPASSFPPIISRLLSARLYRLATFHILQTPSLAKDHDLLESVTTHLEYNGAGRLAEGLRGINWKGGKARLGGRRKTRGEPGQMMRIANHLGSNRHQPPTSMRLGHEGEVDLASPRRAPGLSLDTSLLEQSLQSSLSSLPSEISRHLPPLLSSSSGVNEAEDHLLELSHILLAIIRHQADCPSYALDQQTKDIVVGLWITYARGFLRGRRRDGVSVLREEEGKEMMAVEEDDERVLGVEGPWSKGGGWGLPPTAETVMLFFRHISLLLAPPTPASPAPSTVLPSSALPQHSSPSSSSLDLSPSSPASVLARFEDGVPVHGGQETVKREDREEELVMDEESRRQQNEYDWDHLCRPLCRYTLRLLRLARSYHSNHPPIFQPSPVVSTFSQQHPHAPSPSLALASSTTFSPLSPNTSPAASRHSPVTPPSHISSLASVPRLPKELYLRKQAAWERQLDREVSENCKEVRAWMVRQKEDLLKESFRL
ncbi:hypothetical protein IAR50_003731 [Cryptococcus sp. DSM 104548]